MASSRSTSTGRSSRGSSRGSSSRSRGTRGRSSAASSFLGIEGLPGWAPYAITVVSICGLVYGLMQISVVSDFMEPVLDDVGEFLGFSEEEGIASQTTHDRSYSSGM